MASIELGTAPSVPHGSLRDALDWTRVVVATIARGVVITLLGMALWAAAPAVLGWHPTTVMTGSMEPRLTPGDVVVSRPVDPAQLRVGQVILYDDPDQAGELRLHRIHSVEAGNMLVTKGDANPAPDSTPISRSVVHGVAFIRVPYIGTPIVWLRDGEWHKVVLLVLALTLVASLGTIDGSLRRIASAGASSDPDGSGSDPGVGSGVGPGPDGLAELGLEARDESATPLTVTMTRREYRERLRRVRRLRRAGTALAVVLVVGGAGVLLPAKAMAATFGATATNPTSHWTAGTVVAPAGLTCTSNADKTVTIAWTYSGATPGSFDVVSGSTVLGSATGTATSVKIAGSGALNLGTTYTANVRTNLVGAWTATSVGTVSFKTTGVLGSMTATCV